MQNLVGYSIDNYIIEAEVGRGGMARVYRARHAILQRRSAVKVLLPELASDEHFVERFLREARSAGQLEHPNIVPIYEIGEYYGYHYIAMKYLDGVTLREVITRGAPDLSAIVSYVYQVASALDYAHQHGTIHRDVKPSNIIVDDNGWATLTDFGIARASEDFSLTTAGMLVGTPAYMSPEQAQGLPASPQSDIYSLGIVVYELLSGSTPYPQRTPHAVVMAHIIEPPLPVNERVNEISPIVGKAVNVALAKNPEDRYRTATDFARELALAAGVDPITVRHVTPLPAAPRKPSAVPVTPGASATPTVRGEERASRPGQIDVWQSTQTPAATSTTAGWLDQNWFWIALFIGVASMSFLIVFLGLVIFSGV